MDLSGAMAGANPGLNPTATLICDMVGAAVLVAVGAALTTVATAGPLTAVVLWGAAGVGAATPLVDSSVAAGGESSPTNPLPGLPRRHRCCQQRHPQPQNPNRQLPSASDLGEVVVVAAGEDRHFWFETADG